MIFVLFGGVVNIRNVEPPGTPWTFLELPATPWNSRDQGVKYFMELVHTVREPLGTPPKYFSSPILSHGGLLAIHGSRRSKWHETRCVLQTTMIVCDQKGHAQQFFSLRLS